MAACATRNSRLPPCAATATLLLAAAVALGVIMRPGDLRLSAREAWVNLDSGAFTATGGVRTVRAGADVSGERAEGNFKRKTMTVRGHVVAREAASPPLILNTKALTVDWAPR